MTRFEFIVKVVDDEALSDLDTDTRLRVAKVAANVYMEDRDKLASLIDYKDAKITKLENYITE